MQVLNMHEGSFRADGPVGALLDALASPHDALWPRDT